MWEWTNQSKFGGDIWTLSHSELGSVATVIRFCVPGEHCEDWRIEFFNRVHFLSKTHHIDNVKRSTHARVIALLEDAIRD